MVVIEKWWKVKTYENENGEDGENMSKPAHLPPCWRRYDYVVGRKDDEESAFDDGNQNAEQRIRP